MKETPTLFDDYWAATWRKNDMPPVFNNAMREIAETAWNTATAIERERCTALFKKRRAVNVEVYHCDACGRFVSPYDPLARRLVTPDSEYTTEDYETLCRKCREKRSH